jgi:hypothetical protein
LNTRIIINKGQYISSTCEQRVINALVRRPAAWRTGDETPALCGTAQANRHAQSVGITLGAICRIAGTAGASQARAIWQSHKHPKILAMWLILNLQPGNDAL